MSIKTIKPATLRKVVNYLQDELGLSVYGPCVNLDSGYQYAAHMDYSADDVVKLRALFLNGGSIWDDLE